MMLTARNRLTAWMKREQLTQRDAAQALSLHWTVLNKIVTGRRVPGLAVALRIEDVTGIPVRAWRPTPVGDSVRRPRVMA